MSTNFIVNNTFVLDGNSLFICGKMLSIDADTIILSGGVQLNAASSSKRLNLPEGINGYTFAYINAVSLFWMQMSSSN